MMFKEGRTQLIAVFKQNEPETTTPQVSEQVSEQLTEQVNLAENVSSKESEEEKKATGRVRNENDEQC